MAPDNICPFCTLCADRGHKLAIQDKALEFEKLRGASRMAAIGAASDSAWNPGAIEALRNAVRTWLLSLKDGLRPSWTSPSTLARVGFRRQRFDGGSIKVIGRCGTGVTAVGLWRWKDVARVNA
jgi:hypothetical protein